MPASHISPPTVHRYSLAVYPLHAIFLAGIIPLFLGAMLSDIAYASSYHIQWSNFASWLIAGGLVFTAVAFLFAIVDLFRTRFRVQHHLVYAGLLLLTFIVGFVNSLIHATDAWAMMPTGLILSVVITVLACIAAWFGFYPPRIGDRK